MKKQNLKKMAKAITLGLVLGTALTATSSVWAEDREIVITDVSTGEQLHTGIYFDGGKVSWGTNTTASGTDATAFGFKTTASGNRATAFGLNTIASGDYATAFGFKSEAVGKASFAGGGDEGDNKAGGKAYGKSSFAFGIGAVAGDENDSNKGINAVSMGGVLLPAVIILLQWVMVPKPAVIILWQWGVVL